MPPSLKSWICPWLGDRHYVTAYGDFDALTITPACHTATVITGSVFLSVRSTRWNEVCQTAPLAVEELLHAWQHGTIDTEKIKVCQRHVYILM